MTRLMSVYNKDEPFYYGRILLITPEFLAKEVVAKKILSHKKPTVVKILIGYIY